MGGQSTLPRHPCPILKQMSFANILAAKSCVFSAMQDRTGSAPHGPCLPRLQSLPEENRPTDKELICPCVRLLFSSMIDPSASYPGPMHMTTPSVHNTTLGGTIHVDHQLNWYPLKLCNMATLILLDQINKHHILSSSETDNISSLISGHSTLGINLWKVYELRNTKYIM